jgi:hypothetical protein
MNKGPDVVRLISSKDEIGKGYALFWGAAASSELRARLRQQPTELRATKATSVEVNATGDYVLASDAPLELYYNGIKVLSVRAPAYRPAKPNAQ